MTKSNQRREFWCLENDDTESIRLDSLKEAKARQELYPNSFKECEIIHWREVSPQLDKAIEGMREALVLWLKFEQDCIDKDGPYVGYGIPNQMRIAKQALDAFEKAKGVK